MVRLILAALAVLLAAVAGFVGYRTYSFTAPPPPADVDDPGHRARIAIDASAAAMRLGEAIRFRTVSLVEETEDRAQFEQFHAWMQQRYPAFHAAARREVIGELSLLYTWEGSDAGAAADSVAGAPGRRARAGRHAAAMAASIRSAA